MTIRTNGGRTAGPATRATMDAMDIASARPVSDLAALAPARDIDRAAYAALRGEAPRLVVLDDDPTGTQTVAGVPVLTAWDAADLEWGLTGGAPGCFVLTNTRSMSEADAARTVREVAHAALEAADRLGIRVAFASRGDSTLRGHYPLETDVLAAVLAERGTPVDAVILAPAYLDAGRLTLDGVHWVADDERLRPVAELDYARDATFGYRSSRLADWVAEKTGRTDVRVLEVPLGALRAPDGAGIADAIERAAGGVVVPDAVDDADLRIVAAAAAHAELAGRTIVYRVGPSFVRARLGQTASGPIPADRLPGRDDATGGLVVVGSHVELTTRQLERLRAEVPHAEIVLDVAALLDEARAGALLAAAEDDIVDALGRRLVVVSTSRRVVTGDDAATSLRIATTVSRRLTDLVARVVARRRPKFVVAKGGITSADVATRSLGLTRAVAVGTLLPGIVSLWEPAPGAEGAPLVVFAGNVGDDDSLVAVVRRWEA